MKNLLRHLSSFFAPVVMGFVLPALIVWFDRRSGRSWMTSSLVMLVLGSALILTGPALLVTTSFRYDPNPQSDRS